MNSNIYIVEDDPVTRETLVHLVNAMGWSPTAYGSAAECLKAVEAKVPGCILTDLHMPSMNGAAMIETLRLAGQTVPIIAITGIGDDAQLVRRAKAAGLTAVLSKPVPHQELKKLLNDLLAGEWVNWKLT